MLLSVVFEKIAHCQFGHPLASIVAALHNYPGGVIVHDDIQLCQYLWTEDNGINVKLNDFNRAEFMLFDEMNQDYCKFRNGEGHGDVSLAVCSTLLSHSLSVHVRPKPTD